MSKQTRKSISLSGATYARLKERCMDEKRSMSGTVENLILVFLNRQEQK